MKTVVRSPDIVSLGADLKLDGRCGFRVWAPAAKTIELVDCKTGGISAMHAEENGYWHCEMHDVKAGFSYRFRIDGERERPDPASHRQPGGVHGPSAVVDHASFVWTDLAWKGLSPEGIILYELHTGTFSPEGTFDGVARRLDHLNDLGINAIELMPVAQFPGERNWGYDGVYPFAVQDSYGGVDGLKRLVDACHCHGIAVILDVVYNHLGPEGNYIWDFGPYFTQDKYRTPWGWAVNFDDAYSDEVRAYFIANALHWLDTFHIDGLRLDAVHSIFDMSARPFLLELAEAVRGIETHSGCKRMVIAESDLNDPRLIRTQALGGMGLDAQWSDDLHHGIHAALTGERQGYYRDFGDCTHVAKALGCGYSYCGDYSRFRKRRHGAKPDDTNACSFIVCSQNHDQIGNRMLGERLVTLTGPDGARLAAAAVLLSPMIPMLFMGEEWGETAPFLYFVNFGDGALCNAVREGRKKEFEALHGEVTLSDPSLPDTFLASKLDWTKCISGKGKLFLNFYRQLIELRKNHPVFRTPSFDRIRTFIDPHNAAIVSMIRYTEEKTAACFFNFGAARTNAALPHDSDWSVLISSADRKFGGSGPDSEGKIEKDRICLPGKSCIALETSVIS
jgi:maltooligosyltrehalose trehalohydrolase